MPGIIMLIMLLTLLGCLLWADGNYENEGPALITAIVVIVIGLSVLVFDYTQTSERTIIVEGKDRGADDGSYRIYTDGDTLAVKDIWISMSNRRFDSADLYGDIEVCNKYRITTRGWEFGPGSQMPNIDTIVEDLGPVDGCVPRD